ncbi:hypothetical protein PGB28_13360 [Primorskyibacter aestuariivivens]|uniref:hypothetical protein n=1 Tax=Primorskyibacter aestuariivivens TaxID=1888912 RepID=UPI0022FFFD02|nr:hypothetical protein [Primorskyibacter aestuariivivens]MDA7429451.1 hypothetical protein [Primorskyibacter aestuariivivens]
MKRINRSNATSFAQFSPHFRIQRLAENYSGLKNSLFPRRHQSPETGRTPRSSKSDAPRSRVKVVRRSALAEWASMGKFKDFPAIWLLYGIELVNIWMQFRTSNQPNSKIVVIFRTI